jgi:hypothetical protein
LRPTLAIAHTTEEHVLVKTNLDVIGFASCQSFYLMLYQQPGLSTNIYHLDLCQTNMDSCNIQRMPNALI